MAKKTSSLDKKILSLDFQGGLNQLDADHTLEAGHLVEARNVVFDERGSLHKRAGLAVQSNVVVEGGSQSSLAVGKQIVSYKNGVIGFDNKKAFHRLDQDGVTNGDAWLAGENIVDCRYDQRSIANARTMSQSNAQIHTKNGKVFTAWSEHDVRDAGPSVEYRIYLTIRDETTDAILMNRHLVRTITLSTSATSPCYHIPRVQLTHGGNYVGVVWSQGAKIKCVTVDSTRAAYPQTSAVFDLNSTDMLADKHVFTITHINQTNCPDQVVWVQTKAGASTELIIAHGTLGDGAISSVTETSKTVSPVWPFGTGTSYQWGGLALCTMDAAGRIIVGFTVTGTDAQYQMLSSSSGGGFADVSSSVKIDDGSLLNLSLVRDPADTTRYRGVATILTDPITAKGNVRLAQDHKIVMFSLDTNGAILHANATVTMAHYASMHSDLFVYDGEIYGVCSQSFRPSNREDYRWDNSRNYLIQFDYTYDESGNVESYRMRPMAVSRMGECAINYAVDYNFGANDSSVPSDNKDPAKRRMFSLQRVQNIVGSYKYRFGSSRWAGLQPDGSNSPHNLAETTLDFAPARYLPSKEAAGSLFMGGGFLWEYSGDRLKEHGFFTGTEIQAVTSSGVTGSLSTGTYRVRVVLEWTAANGDVHRSIPSDAMTFNAALAHSWNVVVHCPSFSYRHADFNLEPPRVVVYRTVAGGTDFHRDVSQALSTTAASMSFAYEGTPDDELIKNENLYTGGGKVGNVTPGSITDIAFHKDRLMVATIDNDVWFSKLIADGFAPEFSDIQMLVPRDRTEEITAIESNMDAFLIFTDRNGYFIGGEGPNASQTQGGYTPPRVFAPGMGASRGTAHVEYSGGVMIVLNGALFSIGRDLKLSYVGAAIRDREPISAKAMLVRDDRKEVQVVTGDANDHIIVFNTVFRQVTTIHPTLSGVFVGATMIGLAPHYMIANGKEFVEDKFKDVDTSTTSVTVKVRTPWIKIGQLHQLQRIYRVLVMGTPVSVHTLQVAVSKDNNESVIETKDVELAAGTAPEWVRMRLNTQKMRSIQLTITDVPADSDNREAITLHGLGLEIGLRGGTFKVNSNREIT